MATSASTSKNGNYGDLRRRLVFLLLALVVYRVGAHIPVPGIDPTQLQQLFNGQQGGILSLYIGSYVVAIPDYNSNEVRTDEHYIIDETARDKGKNPSAEVVYYLWDDITRVTFKTR